MILSRKCPGQYRDYFLYVTYLDRGYLTTDHNNLNSLKRHGDASRNRPGLRILTNVNKPVYCS